MACDLKKTQHLQQKSNKIARHILISDYICHKNATETNQNLKQFFVLFLVLRSACISCDLVLACF